jgi:hypothetical protein
MQISLQYLEKIAKNCISSAGIIEFSQIEKILQERQKKDFEFLQKSILLSQ